MYGQSLSPRLHSQQHANMFTSPHANPHSPSGRPIKPENLNQGAYSHNRLGKILQRSGHQSNSKDRDRLDVISEKESVSTYSRSARDRSTAIGNNDARFSPNYQKSDNEYCQTISDKVTERTGRGREQERRENPQTQEVRIDNISNLPSLTTCFHKPEPYIPDRSYNTHQSIIAQQDKEHLYRQDVNLPPNFEALFVIIGENSLNIQRCKQIVKMFINCQIQKLIQVSNVKGANRAYMETKALQEVLNLYKNYAENLYAEGKLSDNYQLVAQQIWRYMFDVQTAVLGNFFSTYQKQASELTSQQQAEMGYYVRKQFDWDKLNKEREFYQATWGDKEETLSEWTKRMDNNPNDWPDELKHKKKNHQTPVKIVIRKYPSDCDGKWKIVRQKKSSQGQYQSLNGPRFHKGLRNSEVLTQPTFTPIKQSTAAKSKETTPNRIDPGMKVNYTVDFLWYENNKRIKYVHRQTNKLFFGIYVKGSDIEDVRKEIEQDARNNLQEIDIQSQVCVGDLQRCKTAIEYQVKVEIKQTIFNLPEGYSWSGIRVDGTIYKNLIISNQHGHIEWLEDIDLAFVNFKEAVQLAPKEFIVEQALEKHCRIKMWGLPGQLVSIPSGQIWSVFSKNFSKLGATLLEISKEGGREYFTVEMFKPQTK